MQQPSHVSEAVLSFVLCLARECIWVCNKKVCESQRQLCRVDREYSQTPRAGFSNFQGCESLGISLNAESAGVVLDQGPEPASLTGAQMMGCCMEHT